MSNNEVAADRLWLDGAFRVDTRLRDAEGHTPPREGTRYAVPGMPNLHSHAFQRAMAGLAERRANADDSFWTWREVMYAFAGRIGPDELRAIAAQVYVEMLKAGYTRVCEFHYLHHRPDGGAYDDPAAMSLALIEAAEQAGIGLTLLPTLYMTGGFDGRALSDRQKRFGHDVHGYLRLVERLRALESDRLRVGIALHSLRAVPEAAMREVLESPIARDCVIHIHIAEQLGEVQDCLALRNARPVEWLLDHAPVGARWCLVHATHMTDGETRRLAKTGAVAGLCPTTEANLGDGLFALPVYLSAGGVLGVGSDSHISVSPVEELRWLEYGQRLLHRHRNISARAADASVAQTLWDVALAGGLQACGLRAGDAADWLVLDAQAPTLAARDERSVFDSFVFAGNVPLVRDVMAGGRWVVRDFHHVDEERILERFRRALA